MFAPKTYMSLPHDRAGVEMLILKILYRGFEASQKFSISLLFNRVIKFGDKKQNMKWFNSRKCIAPEFCNFARSSEIFSVLWHRTELSEICFQKARWEELSFMFSESNHKRRCRKFEGDVSFFDGTLVMKLRVAKVYSNWHRSLNYMCSKIIARARDMLDLYLRELSAQFRWVYEYPRFVIVTLCFAFLMQVFSDLW